MGVRSFFSSVGRLLKLAKKPARDELWLSIRICLLGIAVIGAVGYVIHFMASMLQQWSV
jgi:protein translocase SEC61 complex gamma subunit